MYELRTIAVVYEDREQWVRTAHRRLSQKAREELSHWLLDKPSILGLCDSLAGSAKRNGARVELLSIGEFTRNFSDFSSGRKRNRTLVWNITDGQAGFKGSHVPSLAILADIPYFGCPPYTQTLGQDKFKLFLLCRAIGIPAPRSALADGGITVSSFLERTRGPYFVKPNSLGNKIGITGRALQEDLAGALREASAISRRLGSSAIIQEFVAGPEVRFTFINANVADDLRAPTYGYDVVDAPRWQDGTRVFISEKERDSAYEDAPWQDLWSWRGMPEEARVRTIEHMASAVALLARYVRLKDYFTIDFRVDRHGIPRLIDFNPGAFLDGSDIRGYAEHNLHMPLPDALLAAMRNSFAGREPAVFARTEHSFAI